MNEEGWHRFLEICFKAQSTQILNRLLNIFLTAEERAAVSKRLLIVEELLKGEKTQREMAKDIKVSIAKITRGSNELKGVDEEFRQFLKQSI